MDRPVVTASEAQRPCRRPVPLDGSDLPLARVERLWATDRVALAECADAHDALIGEVKGRQ